MKELRFDGKVAIITGAGRGIGFAHAKLLGSRGAKLVVNDVKGAEAAVQQLQEMGIEAIADSHNIANMQDAQAIVDMAVKHYGKVDILVNNAGVNGAKTIEEENDDLYDFIMSVNVNGSRNMCKAVYDVMKKQGYGRIVNTTSNAAMYGAGNLFSYSVSKGAVYGMTRSLALAGKEHGILVNAIAPAAATIMAMQDSGFVVTDPEILKATEKAMPTEAISPIVAILAHEDCPTNGKVFETCAGRVNEIFVGTTMGYYDPTFSPEVLLEHLDDVRSQEDFAIVDDMMSANGLLEVAIKRQYAKGM